MTSDIPFRDPAVPLTRAQALLRIRVHEEVIRNPDTFSMDGWETHLHDKGSALCRTTRCLAGWAQYLAEGKVDSMTVYNSAIAHLGLTIDEYLPPREGGLFYASDADAVKRMGELAAAAKEILGDDDA